MEKFILKKLKAKQTLKPHEIHQCILNTICKFVCFKVRLRAIMNPFTEAA